MGLDVQVISDDKLEIQKEEQIKEELKSPSKSILSAA